MNNNTSSSNNYRVYWTNHGYYSQEQFGSLAAAIAYGKSKCFEFTVHEGSTMHAAWSPIGGLRTYSRAAENYCRQN